MQQYLHNTNNSAVNNQQLWVFMKQYMNAEIIIIVWI